MGNGRRFERDVVRGGAVDLGSVGELERRLQEVAARDFGANIGALVRAIDLWENGGEGWAEDGPPEWARAARDGVVRHMEFLAEQQGR